MPESGGSPSATCGDRASRLPGAQRKRDLVVVAVPPSYAVRRWPYYHSQPVPLRGARRIGLDRAAELVAAVNSPQRRRSTTTCRTRPRTAYSRTLGALHSPASEDR